MHEFAIIGILSRRVDVLIDCIEHAADQKWFPDDRSAVVLDDRLDVVEGEAGPWRREIEVEFNCGHLSVPFCVTVFRT